MELRGDGVAAVVACFRMQESQDVAPVERPPTTAAVLEETARETADELGPPSLPSYDGLRPLAPGQWRVHDRTHLELLVDYPVVDYQRQQGYVWEAYFFLPQSLRLDAASYPKVDIYRDFQSYVRFAAKEPTLDELGRIPSERLLPVLDDDATLMREARVFGCQFRAAAQRGRERLLQRAERGKNARSELRALGAGLRQAVEAFDAVTADARRPKSIRALRQIGEDLARVREELFATVCVAWRKMGDGVGAEIAESLALEAARQREAVEGGTSGGGRHREAVDESEFRRHALKRFTSSVLWLEREISDAGAVVRELLFALAASVAMVFAVAAALYSGPPVDMHSDRLLWWGGLVVLAYALKDRIKASLQGVFSGWMTRHFADRRWRLHAHGLRRLGIVEERSRFVAHSSVPSAVHDLRKRHNAHDIENVAHPERVLWHHKSVALRSSETAQFEPRFAAVTEVFRLDVSRWLTHTDDPKQQVHLADTRRDAVYTVMARRVYHVDIVFRNRRADDETAPWRQCRVVLSRSGIRSARART